ncbi:protein AF-10 isoform X1 [Gadus morhua]|uniref:protein AF-10 isoform X1 n=1 Tax=Gadus morhua TaxID=8049 RepID=UPI0011B4ECD8|nr:protein AF-10 isoform X1 [Gadus morhua]
MKEMIGGCCVCSDERGWAENPLVYCDGHGCNVAVHQACYGIVQVPTGPWFCRKCESQERAARVRCELCPHKDGALKRTDNGGWAHVVCALYIPEVEFANVSTMEPIVLQSVPHDRYNKTCYICEDQGRESKAATGACMTCNKHGCRQAFHVTCAQFAGLLCEEQGSDADNVKYCGYCKYHHSKLRRSRGRGSRSQSLSDSSPQCMDRASDQDNKKHKERDRHKPKHKKTPLDMSPSLVLLNTTVPDKGYTCSSTSGGGVASLPAPSQKRLDDSGARFTTANFQEVPLAHAGPGGAKDGPAADSGKMGPDPKIKKSNIVGAGAGALAGCGGGGSHVVGQRGGRKTLTSSAKPLPSAVVTMATSSTSATASTGPFHQGLLLTSASKTSSAPSSSDFLGFSDSSLRPGGGTTFSSPPSFSSCLVKTASEGGASDGSTTLFGSMMSATVASGVGGKLYENSHTSLTSPPDTVSLSSGVGFKRAQPSTSSVGPGLAGAIGGCDDSVKKKKKGNWRNRFGPCFTTDSKPSEPAPSLTLPVSATANAVSSSSSSSSSSASVASPSPASSALTGRPGVGGMTGVGAGGGAVSAGGGAGGGGERMLGVVGVGIQKSPSLLRNGTLPGHTGSTPTGAGAFSIGDGLSSVTGLGAMGGANSDLAQQQTPAPSLAPPSPFMATAPLTTTASTHVSSLPGSVFNLAPSHMFGNRLNPNSAMAALIAQSEATPADQEAGDGSTSSVGAQGFSIRASPKTTPRSPIGGLQIRYDPSGSLSGPGLGMLGAGCGGGGGDTLPPVVTSIEQLLERQWSDGQNFLMQQEAQGDVVAMLKSLHQLQVENKRLEEQIRSLTVKKERLQLLSAQLSVPFTPHSASSDVKGSQLGAADSSLPVAAQDSASCGGRSSNGSTSSLSTPPSVSQSPPQLNGLASVATGLGGGQVGSLNGVIQSREGGLTPRGDVGPLNYRLGNASSMTTAKNSSARHGLMSEQQRLLLQHHQLQQLLSSHPTAEQQQVLLYQLMQQQQDLQQIHAQMPLTPSSSSSSSAQLPVGGLQPAPQGGPGAITSNPFLAMQHAHADGGPKPRLTADKTEKT